MEELFPAQFGYNGRQIELGWGRARSTLKTVRTYNPREMMYRAREGKPEKEEFLYPKDIIKTLILEEAQIVDTALINHEGWLDKNLYMELSDNFYLYIDRSMPFTQIRRRLGGKSSDPAAESMAYWVTAFHYEELLVFFEKIKKAFPGMPDPREALSPPVEM